MTLSKLGAALREKFGDPKKAMEALGLDQALINEEIAIMSNEAVARRINAVANRAVTVGALVSYLRPRLAMDAKKPVPVSLAIALDGVTGKNFASKKPAIAASIRAQAKGHLAQDASLDDVEKVLDLLDKHEVDGVADESVSEPQHKAMEAAAHGASTLGIPEKVGEEFAKKDAKKGFDAEGFEKFLKGKGMGDDDVAEAMDMVMPKAGENALDAANEDDDDDEAKKKDAAAKDAAAKAAKDAAAEKDEKKDMVSKPAMDAAIKAATELTAKTVRDEVRATERAIRQAEGAVFPYVGKLSPDLALDSAADVFKAALTMRGVNIKDVHPSAFPTLLGMLPKAGAQPVERGSMAQDSAVAPGFAELYPDVARITSI